jgi:hypothetical protein
MRAIAKETGDQDQNLGTTHKFELI